MSAPARRMAVSASIIARRSSSQPSCPAALIMAYSPDTEYAASGTPNSLLAREMTSRYGRAGLTMTMSAPSSRASAISRMASVAFAGSIWDERRSPHCGADRAASRKGAEQLTAHAGPVAGVAAEAHVGDDEQIRRGVRHGAGRLLDDAVVGVGFRPAGVFVGGQTEHQHRGDAVARDVLGLSHQLVDGEPELS